MQITEESSPALTDRNEDLQDLKRWLSRKGVDVEGLLLGTLRELGSRHLPKGNLVRYQRRTLLNVFLVTWAEVNQARFSWIRLPKQERVLIEKVIILGLDGFTFEKVLRSSSRLHHLVDLGKSRATPRVGSPSAYEGFVASNAGRIAQRFYERFDPTNPRAARGAFKYLARVATSAYRTRFASTAMKQPRGLMAYLHENPRIETRTRLAVKLLLLPEAILPEERNELREHHNFDAKPGRRYKVKEVAERLAYRNAASLSRKLWKIKKWASSYRRKVRRQPSDPIKSASQRARAAAVYGLPLP